MDRKRITWYTEQLIDDYIWVSDFRYNALFRISTEFGDAEYVGSFLGENSDARELHLSSIRNGTKIYFLPQHAKTIGGFDTDKNEFFSIECEKNINENTTIINAFDYAGYLWLVPRYLDIPIQALDVNGDKVVKRISFEKKLDLASRNEYQLLYACMINGKILAPIHNTNKIIRFSPDDESIEIKEIAGLSRITGAVASVRQGVWISTDKGVYTIDKNNKIDRLSEDYLKEGNWIEAFIESDNKIVCVPRWIDKVAVYDLDTMSVKYIELNDTPINTRNDLDWKWRDFKSCMLSKDVLTISPLRFSEALVINIESGSITQKSYKYPKKFNPFKSSIAYEVDNSSLSDFISFI